MKNIGLLTGIAVLSLAFLIPLQVSAAEGKGPDKDRKEQKNRDPERKREKARDQQGQKDRGGEASEAGELDRELKASDRELCNELAEVQKEALQENQPPETGAEARRASPEVRAETLASGRAV